MSPVWMAKNYSVRLSRGVCAVAMFLASSVGLAQVVPLDQHPSHEFGHRENLRRLFQFHSGSSLLHGLPQRLDTDRDFRALKQNEVPGNAQLRLGIKASRNVDVPIRVGLFHSPDWCLHEPAYVREMPRAGVHELVGLAPGKYFIGAMAGELPYPQAIGVHEGWPAPIVVSPGQSVSARVKISDESKWECYTDLAFTRLESRTAACAQKVGSDGDDHLIRVSVRDQHDSPVSYAHVRLHP